VLTYVIIGLVSGAVYGLAALGLVIVYKGSRIFNFAQGEFGTMAMYVMFLLVELAGLPYFAAIPAGLVTGVVLGLLTERFVARPLAGAQKVISLVGTAGVALLLVGLTLVFADPKPRSVTSPLVGVGPTVAGFVISQQQIFTIIVLAVVAAASAFFFKKTFLGMAILANSQDSTAVRIVGASVNRISAITWGIAGLLGALTGVVLAPDVAFYPGYMTTVVLIPAFTAAIVGGMTSLAGVFVAGQIVGLIEAMGSYMVSQFPGALRSIPEAPAFLVFLVLVIVLLVRPRGLFGAEA
jgi:branched-chain amino acid transport system permease protein